jgi:hypothetical protein
MSKIDGDLRPLFRRWIPHFDWTSIESGTTGGGIPDSNACYRGTELWIEYKQTAGHAVTLRPEQVGWIARRVRHGGRVWIAVRRRHDGGPRLGDSTDELWLLPGALATAAKAGGLRSPEVVARARVWRGGPGGGWDWRAIAAALVA